MMSAPAAGDARILWLAMVQRLMGRAAHDVKDALNGVSVNVEVIRSRAGRDGVPASAVAPFADAAEQQLERLTSLLEALLAVARTEREPVDIGVALRRVATLCAASGRAGGAGIVIEGETSGESTTTLPGEVVRLALAAPLLEAMLRDTDEPAVPVRCTLREAADAVHVTIADSSVVTMPAEVGDVVRRAGIRWTNEEQGTGTLSLAFPRA